MSRRTNADLAAEKLRRAEQEWLLNEALKANTLRGDCCAACRRGTKAHGTEAVCGYGGKCPKGCHDRKGTR